VPFTVSHVAAVLPLHAWSKTRLPLAALMIGSMAPDFAYFVPIGADRMTTHNLFGLLWFCLPAGIAVWWVFVRLMERPTLALIPEPWRAGLPPPTHRISFSLAIRAGIAVLLGGVTHLAWDALTHSSTPVVDAFPVLRETIVPIAGARMPLYHFLQFVSSIAGLAVLGIWALRLRQKPQAATVQTLPAVSTGTRIAAAAIIVLGACALALAYYAYHSRLRFENRMFYTAIGGMTGWALAWCGVAVWIRMRWSAARS
jgi:uncharacterized membrane protein